MVFKQKCVRKKQNKAFAFSLALIMRNSGGACDALSPFIADFARLVRFTTLASYVEGIVRAAAPVQ